MGLVLELINSCQVDNCPLRKMVETKAIGFPGKEACMVGTFMDLLWRRGVVRYSLDSSQRSTSESASSSSASDWKKSRQTWHAAEDGDRIVSVSSSKKAKTPVNNHAFSPLSVTDASFELAEKYFHWYGPASLKDLLWWWGGRADVRGAFKEMRAQNRLQSVEIEGMNEELYMLIEDIPRLQEEERCDEVSSPFRRRKMFNLCNVICLVKSWLNHHDGVSLT